MTTSHVSPQVQQLIETVIGQVAVWMLPSDDGTKLNTVATILECMAQELMEVSERCKQVGTRLLREEHTDAHR